MDIQDHNPETVYLMKPRLGGLANDLWIQTEAGQELYHVRSKSFTPMGRVYTVTDAAQQPYLTVQQQHSVIFPRYTLVQDKTTAATVGQSSVVPQQYFIQVGRRYRSEIHIGAFDTIFRLEQGKGILDAEVAQHRQTWIVIIHSQQHRTLILLGLAVIYRINCIGG